MNTRTCVWPTLIYRDGPAAIAFLCEAFGFTETAVYRRAGDDRIIDHAELAWPEGGGVMLGSVREDQPPFGTRPTGVACTYVVCTDPDALCARAVAHGAEVAVPLTDQDYGSRDFAVRDPEGNLWSFGTYPGADAA